MTKRSEVYLLLNRVPEDRLSTVAKYLETLVQDSPELEDGSLEGAFPELAAITEEDIAEAKRIWDVPDQDPYAE